MHSVGPEKKKPRVPKAKKDTSKSRIAKAKLTKKAKPTNTRKITKKEKEPPKRISEQSKEILDQKQDNLTKTKNSQPTAPLPPEVPIRAIEQQMPEKREYTPAGPVKPAREEMMVGKKSEDKPKTKIGARIISSVKEFIAPTTVASLGVGAVVFAALLFGGSNIFKIPNKPQTSAGAKQERTEQSKKRAEQQEASKPTSIKFKGLGMLLHNAEWFLDVYIYNVVTGDNKFIYKGFAQEGVTRGKYTYPCNMFIFKMTGFMSNALLPKRIRSDEGRYLEESTTLANAINRLTCLKASSVDAIRWMLVETYKRAFEFTLDKNSIEVVAAADGSVASIKYHGADKGRKLITSVATSLKPRGKEKEGYYIGGDQDEEFNLVDFDDNLIFPPSLYVEHSILVPTDYLKQVDKIKLEYEFDRQRYLYGYTIPEGSKRFMVTMSPDNLIETQKHMTGQRMFETSRYTDADGNVTRSLMANINRSVINDTFTKQLAEIITSDSGSREEEAQDLLSFVQSLDYFPELGEAPRFIHATLLGRGGDCDDKVIAYATLLKERGIDSIIIYYNGHVGVGVAGDFKGPHSIKWGDKRYYYAETTVKGHPIGDVSNLVSNEGKGPMKVQYVQHVGTDEIVKMK